MKFVPYWKRNLEYYIKRTFIDNQTNDISSIEQYIVEHFKEKYITESDRKLLNLFFKNDVTQDDLDRFLEEWDIEKEGGHKALMLSYFMKLHPELHYSEYIEPRLNGILKYYRFRNLNLMAHYKKICTALKAENIDILVIKGGALRYFHPEFPRIMGDIDILVHSEDYEKAKNIALSFGYKYTEYKHSIDLYDDNDNTVLDIHRKLDMQTGFEKQVNEDFFGRSHKETVFSVNDVYIPSPEDMMFMLLINLNKNMVQYTCVPSILYSIIDSMHLINIKHDFDWDIVKQNAIKTKTEHQITVAVDFLNAFVPNKLPIMFENEFYEKSVMYLYNEWFMKSLRKKSHTLFSDTCKKIVNNIKYYFKFRFLYLKYKQKSYRTNIELAKSVLEEQDIIKNERNKRKKN